MTYVVSNLHGALKEFSELLDTINFSKDDVMFVLGDIVDYGEDSVELLCDLSFRDNVWAIAGEHDRLALQMLEGFENMLASGSAPDEEYIAKMNEWMSKGGAVTLNAFRSLEKDMREGVIEYLSDLPTYEVMTIDDTDYLLLHSGIKDYSADVELDEYEESAFCEDDCTRKIDGYTVVCGHLPTNVYFEGDGDIYHGDGYIAIDCGASRGGRLACLCLEDGREYYV